MPLLRTPWNPPGLSQISYRIGTWATFRASMLGQVRVARPPGASAPPLADAALQGPNDWITALIDAWAVVGDILTFYQERIANEGYLGTATQPFSIAQLFQMIGFPPPQPTAAATDLAFTVSRTTAASTPAGPGSLVLSAGSAVRSLPVPVRTAADLEQLVARLAQAGSAPVGSQTAAGLEKVVARVSGAPPPPTPPGAAPAAAPPVPQIFETTEAVAVHPAWNNLQPQVRVRVERPAVRGSTTELRLAGTSTGLKMGQPILITGDPRPAQAPSTSIRTLIAVEADRAQGLTWVRWESPLHDQPGAPPQAPLRRLENPQVFAFGKQLALFGATAKDWSSLPRETRRGFAQILGGVLREETSPDGPVWTILDRGLPLVDVNALATTGGALFAGTAGKGVYRSTDGGRIWLPASTGLSRTTVQCLLAAGPPGQLLAGGLGGVYLSTDGGQTWEPLAGGPPQVVTGSPPGGTPQIVPTSLPATVVRALAGFNGLLVAGTDSGIFTYDGTAWSQAALDAPEGPPLPAMGQATNAFAGGTSSPSGLLYAAASDGVYQSPDGATWSPMSPLPESAWPLRALALAGGLLFAGGYDGVYGLSPGGWTRLSGPEGPVTALTATGADLAAATAQDGLWSSPDLGTSWARVPIPLPTPSWPILALLATGEGLLVATPFDGFDTRNWPGFHLQGNRVDLGTTDNKIVAGGRVALLQSRPAGPPLSGGYAITKVETVQRQAFLLDALITRLLVVPDTGLADFDLRTTQAWVESRELELEVRSVLVPTPVCGSSIHLDSQLTTPLPPRQKLIVSGKALNTALLPASGVLHRTGGRWRSLALPATGVTALAATDRDLYAATGQGIFLIPRRGRPVRSLPEGLPAPGRTVIALAAGRNGTLYAATHDAVYADPAPGTAGWNELPPLGSPVLALAVDPVDDRLAAGTASDIWSFDGSAWTPLGTGVPDRTLTALLFTADGALYAGTLGAGVLRYGHGSWQPLGKGLQRARVQALAALPGGLAAGTAGGAGAWLWNGTSWQPAATGVSNDVRALAAAGDELFAGCGDASLVTGPGGAQTLEVRPAPLFVYQPDPGARASLDQGNLPDDLVEAFTAHKTPLSSQATVAPRRRGTLWIVQDQNDAVYFLISRSAAAIQVAAAGAVLSVTGRPRRAPGSTRRWPLADQLGFAGSFYALPGEVLLLSARASDPVTSEVARLAQQTPEPGNASAVVRASDRQRTTLRLEKPLAGFYDAATTTVQANVAHATSGQSVREVLGSGDAAQPNQSFPVKRLPVAHVAQDDGTARSTLAVTVGGVPWREVPSLNRAGPDSQVFITTYDATGFATVTFGDGTNGARLPTGRDNVVALYRGGGTGPEAEVQPGGIVQILAAPGASGRVHRVTNPQPAVRARKSPLQPGRVAPPPEIGTLDRIVAAGDFTGILLALSGVAGVRARRLWTGAGLLTGITVLPAEGQTLAPGSALDRQITAALKASSAPGTLVQVTPPASTFFDLKAALWVPAGTPATARQAASAAARQALGDAFGPSGGRLAQAVTAAQATSVLQRVPGVTGAVLQALYLKGDQPGLETALPAADVRWDPQNNAVLPAELLLLDTRGGLTLEVEDAP